MRIHRGEWKLASKGKFPRVRRKIGGDVCYARWVVGKGGCAGGTDKRVIARFANAMANRGWEIRGRASFSK